MPDSATFDLFTQPKPRAGDRVRFPAPSAPGSATSAAAAEELERTGRRQKEVTRCLQWFARQAEPRTRNQLAAELYAGHLGSACGRVADLLTMGWVAETGRVGKRSTLEITETGRRELGEAAGR